MAASLEELMAQYRAKQTEASALAESAGSATNTALAIGGGALGLVGAIAAPIAARYIGDAFGLNERSAAEKAALGRIQNVAEGGRTAAQAALEYQRARVGQQAQQAAAMGPARERAARALVGQEQRIQAEGQVAGRLAEVKSAEQARAQQAIADIETRAGEAERQRQRQMVAGAVTGGLGALAQAYGGYAAGKQRAADLAAQAKGTQAAIDTITAAQGRTTPPSATQELAKPMTEAAKAQQAAAAAPAPPDMTSTYMTGPGGEAPNVLDMSSPQGMAALQRGRQQQTYDMYQSLPTSTPRRRARASSGSF